MVDKSEKFSWLVRLGYLSRAIMYGLIGIIALTGAGRISEGTNGVFSAIEAFPLGAFVLWLLVTGLAAYGLFRFCSTAFDIEHEGSDAEGWAKRIGHFGSGIGHLALSFSAYKFATRDEVSGSGAQQAASGLLSMDLGGIVLALLGGAFFLAALAQARKGITGSFMHRISRAAPACTRVIGGIGYVARSIVFVVMGLSLIKAGLMTGDSEQVKTIGAAVATLADEGVVFALVSVGLLVFGVFSVILARYRIIPDLGEQRKVPQFRLA